jgi:hypothetical protein
MGCDGLSRGEEQGAGSKERGAVRRARAMPPCGNLYPGNTLRALAGVVTLRREAVSPAAAGRIGPGSRRLGFGENRGRSK